MQRATPFIVAVALALAGCGEDPQVVTPDAGATEDASVTPACGNGVVEGDEECDEGSENSATRPNACRPNCKKAFCGDGVVDQGEICDDSTNDGSYGGCAADCKAFGPHCGDGTVNGDEVCDDGTNDGSYGSCSADCKAFGPRCGDGTVSGDEVCDDGINNGSYGSCTADCSAKGPHCGDGTVNGDEVCDDGTNDDSYGGCAADCSAKGPHCGDGTVNGDEVCDDGTNDDSYGGCAANCMAWGPRCGDGTVNGPEVCDDGTNDGSYGGCAADCMAWGPRCGDGIVQAAQGEECDDGNQNDSDMCRSDCRNAACDDNIQNGQEEGVDCGGPDCRPCNPPTVQFVLSPNETPVPLDAQLKLVFSQRMDPQTLNASNISVRAGSDDVDVRFIASGNAVDLTVARWAPNTVYTVSVGTGVKDAWGQSLQAPATSTFTTGFYFSDRVTTLPKLHPLVDTPAPGRTGPRPGEYVGLSKPAELVLLGTDYVNNASISILDFPAYNFYPESETVTDPNLWSVEEPSVQRARKKRARAGHLDNDVRDEIVVLGEVSAGVLALTVIDPTPTADGRGTTYATQVLSHQITAGQNPPRPPTAFDVALGQADNDFLDEIFVVVGGSDGKLFLYIFDDAQAGYDVLKNGEELTSLSGEIRALSLAVDDIDFDGRDELVVAANHYKDASLQLQKTSVTLFAPQGASYAPIQIPLSPRLFHTNGQPLQNNSIVDLIKVDIANIDDDTQAREVIVGYIAGNQDTYDTHLVIEAFRYDPDADTPITPIFENTPPMFSLGGTFVNFPTFSGHPDRVPDAAARPRWQEGLTALRWFGSSRDKGRNWRMEAR